ncbi:MAG: WxcM-like domain-containing protein [bacterium]|nr:WxcM-like domain-containing protein [bacterium]
MEFYAHRIHEDHRRRGAYEIVPGLSGDINFTVHKAGVVPHEWHMHNIHTDYFAVVEGKILFRTISDDGKVEEKVVLTKDDHKTLILPPGVWHNYIALKPSILVFYTSNKFNMADEFRRPCDPEGWNI